MPKPYSNDLRQKIIIALTIDGEQQIDVAKRFNVSTSFVSALYKHYKEKGDVKPNKIGGYCKPKIDAKGEDHISEWIANDPSLTLTLLCDMYEKHFGVKMGESSMSRGLKRMKITFKKKSIRSSKRKPKSATTKSRIH
jgi:transposase